MGFRAKLRNSSAGISGYEKALPPCLRATRDAREPSRFRQCATRRCCDSRGTTRSDQAGTGCKQAVDGALGQLMAQTMHADPGPVIALQSVSFRQSVQTGFSPQKLAFPVVCTQAPLNPNPQNAGEPAQESEPGGQFRALWATQRLLSFLPCFGFLPSQIPEQQFASLPRQGFPTSAQPKALRATLCFFPFPAPGAAIQRLPRTAGAIPRANERRDTPCPMLRARRSNLIASMRFLVFLAFQELGSDRDRAERGRNHRPTAQFSRSRRIRHQPHRDDACRARGAHP
jgi:hypothetical protein